MAEPQDLAVAHRRQQEALRAETIGDVVAVWLALFQPGDGESWTQLRRLLVALIGNRRRTSAGLGSAYYRRVRAVSGVGGSFDPRIPDVPVERVEASLDATGPGAFAKALRAGQTPDQARRTAAVVVSGSASRMVTDGGRDTVHSAVEADEEAIGYIRVTDEDPCAFCAMLASRGPVYKTARTAGDPRAGGIRYHDHDACTAAPVFAGSDDPWIQRSEDLSDLWAQVTAGHSGADARRVWRRFWDNRDRDVQPEPERERAPELEREPEPEVEVAADPLAGVDLTELSDDRLAELFQAHGDDAATVETLLGEMDRRDRMQADEQLPAEPPATVPGWLDEGSAVDDDASFGVGFEQSDESRRVNELVAEGVPEEDAIAEVYGASVQEQQFGEGLAESFGAMGRGTKAQRAREAYGNWVNMQYNAAEEVTNGFLLSREGIARNIDPQTLFSGPAARARRYASEELKRFWQDNPRKTFTEFRAELFGWHSDRRRAGVSGEQGAGREFGL